MVPVIKVDNLGKRFRRYSSKRPKSIIEAVIHGWRHSEPEEFFWVFRGVGFEVCSGEMLGVIGRNGAGKSTLLSLLAGLLRADEGHIRLRGRVSALLDLGRSLHPLLTGRENILTSGLLNGLDSDQVRQRFNRIAEFTEIEEFLDAPVRTYSSGMKARLAFAIAVHTDPDILLVDEFLFVGDQFFQAKCIDRIRELMHNGTAVLLSSHMASKISKYCDRALWLNRSVVQALGPADEVLEQYQSSTNDPDIRTVGQGQGS
jgi:lipopolysaccharide transport system ATP-binding protein